MKPLTEKKLYGRAVIRLSSWDSWGSIKFLVNNKTYTYRVDDSAMLLGVVKIAKHSPGKALNLIKRIGHQFNG